MLFGKPATLLSLIPGEKFVFNHEIYVKGHAEEMIFGRFMTVCQTLDGKTQLIPSYSEVRPYYQ